MISRNVEPDIGAIDQEQFGFWRLIFPPHATGTRKVYGAGVGGNSALAVAIALIKDGFEGAGMLVARLKSPNC